MNWTFMQKKKQYWLFIVCLFTATTLFAEVNPPGLIKGKVLSSDGKPVASVSIQVKDNNKGTVTDENGEFIFRKIPAGTYILTISFVDHETIEQTVEVSAAAVARVNIRLKSSDKELEEVVVKSARNMYKAKNASSSLRLQTPLLKLPQNIQVVPAQLLADQQVFDVVDGITRNVSGVTRQGHWDNQYANIRMRGSKIPAFRNGMNIEASWGPTAEDASMIERIEFVKGPAGFMLANGEPGGFYNVVTKKPTGNTKGSATVSMGSFSTYRAALDFDGKLSKDGKLLYRLNMAAQQKDYYTKYNYSNRYILAPSLKYLLDDKTSVTLEYTYQGSTYLANGNYVFSPKGFADPGIKNDFFYGDPSFEPGKLKDHSVYVYLDHKLNDKWNAHAQVAYFNFSMIANSTWANYLTANGNMNRYWSIGDEAGENRFGQFSFSGEEMTGNIRHRILAGADFGNKKFWGDFRTLKDSLQFPGGKKFNVYAPEYGIPFDSFPKIDRSQNIRTRAGATTYATVVSYGSAYVQDELAFFQDKVRVSLGLRFTYSETVGKSAASDIKDEVITPRAGISYSINEATSVYGLYDKSYVPVSGTDWLGNAFKPIIGRDIEAGIKKEWFRGRWVSSLSGYIITRKNALVQDPDPSHIVNGRTFQAQLGETKTKGIEADISGEVFPGMNVNLNYALTDSKISQATDKTTIGNVTPNTARHIVNAWLQYRIRKGVLEGFGMNGGIQSQSGRSIGSTKETNFPNYFKADAGVSFQKGKYNISLLVNNLLNDQYLLTAGSVTAANARITGSVPYYAYIVEARRNFRMSITYRF